MRVVLLDGGQIPDSARIRSSWKRGNARGGGAFSCDLGNRGRPLLPWRQHSRLGELLLEEGEEAGAHGAVDHAVVVHQGERQHRA